MGLEGSTAPAEKKRGRGGDGQKQQQQASSKEKIYSQVGRQVKFIVGILQELAMFYPTAPLSAQLAPKKKRV